MDLQTVTRGKLCLRFQGFSNSQRKDLRITEYLV